MGFPAWDPVLIDFPGPLDVRWYGLMYVVAFVVGQIIFTRLARAKFLPVEPDRVADLIFYTVIGTILGVRSPVTGHFTAECTRPPEGGRLTCIEEHVWHIEDGRLVKFTVTYLDNAPFPRPYTGILLDPPGLRLGRDRRGHR